MMRIIRVVLAAWFLGAGLARADGGAAGGADANTLEPTGAFARMAKDAAVDDETKKVLAEISKRRDEQVRTLQIDFDKRMAALEKAKAADANDPATLANDNKRMDDANSAFASSELRIENEWWDKAIRSLSETQRGLRTHNAAYRVVADIVNKTSLSDQQKKTLAVKVKQADGKIRNLDVDSPANKSAMDTIWAEIAKAVLTPEQFKDLAAARMGAASKPADK